MTGGEASPSISKVLERAAIAQTDEVVAALAEIVATDVARLLRMPEVAANATVAVLAEWAVAQDADFAASDTLATVETEKALVEIDADSAGVVLKALVPAGSEVEVGAPIAVLGNPGERIGDLSALLAELGVAETTDPVRPERRDVPDPVPDPEGGAASTGPSAPAVEAPALDAAPAEPSPARAVEREASVPSPADGRVAASPLARRLAQAAGIPVEEIDGTGPRRRILRRDVERAVEARAQDGPAVATSAPVTASAATPTPAGAASYDVVPHSRLRRLVAARLAESKQQAPHFYLRAGVRADRLVSLRAEVNDGAETRVSLNDLVLKAVAAAHVRVPEMNAVWTDDAVHRFHGWMSPSRSPPTAAWSPRCCATSPPSRSVPSRGRCATWPAERARAPCASTISRAAASASPTWACTAWRSSPRSSTLPTQPSWPSGRCARSPSSPTGRWPWARCSD